MIYKFVAITSSISTADIHDQFRCIQTYSQSEIDRFLITDRCIQYAREYDLKTVCSLQTGHGKQIASIINTIEKDTLSKSLLSTCVDSVSNRDIGNKKDKEKSYGNQLLYKVAYHRSIYNGTRLIDSLKEHNIPSYEIATTVWFYLRFQRSLLAELMESKHKDKFSCARHSEMNSLFPINSDLQHRVRQLFKEGENRIQIKLVSDTSETLIPTTLERIKLIENHEEEGGKYIVVDPESVGSNGRQPIDAVHAIHHFPRAHTVIDSFKLIESVLDDHSNKFKTSSNLFYFYWLQIHFADLKRGTSAVSEMYVKTMLHHTNIKFQNQQDTIKLDYEALASSPNDFVNFALQELCPTLIPDTPVSVIEEVDKHVYKASNTDHDTNRVYLATDSASRYDAIQQFFINGLHNLGCRHQSLEYVNDYMPGLDIFRYKPDSKNELNLFKLKELFQALDYVDIPIHMLQQKNDLIQESHTDTMCLEKELAYNMICYKAGQLLQKTKHFSNRDRVDVLWYYLRIQSHILASLSAPETAHSIGSNRHDDIYSEYPKGSLEKTVKEQLNKQRKKEIQITFKGKHEKNISPTTIRLFKSDYKVGVVAVQSKKGLDNTIDLFNIPIQLLATPKSPKKIAYQLFKFYQLQIHNAPFTQGTEVVCDLFVRTLLNHFNIKNVEHPSDYHPKFEALTFPKKQFIQRALRYTTPELNRPRFCVF